MNEFSQWGDLPRGGTERAAQAIDDIDRLLRHPACAGRAVVYRIDRSVAVSRAELERWAREADTDGYSAITYAIDPSGHSAVVVDVWASKDATHGNVE